MNLAEKLLGDVYTKLHNGVYGTLIPDEVVMCYSEKHRHWHNTQHLKDVVFGVYHCACRPTRSDEDAGLLLAAIYHDVVYDPRASDNEEKSILKMLEIIAKSGCSIATPGAIAVASDLILKTKDLTCVNTLNKIDREVFYRNNMVDLISYFHKIEKEYSHVDILFFKFHHKLIVTELGIDFDKENYFKYVDAYRPRVAVYSGSFNPFHIGHKAIVEEAERTFGKVILARGKNPDKGPVNTGIRYTMHVHDGRLLIEFEGLFPALLDCLKSNYDVTVVKGLRNAVDMDYERTQEAYLKMISPDFPPIHYILSKPELSHVSSSSLKKLNSLGVETKQYEW